MLIAISNKKSLGIVLVVIKIQFYEGNQGFFCANQSEFCKQNAILILKEVQVSAIKK